MKLKMYEISQQLKYIDNVGVFVSSLDNLTAIDKYAWIIHDKDIKEDGTPVEPHIHLFVRLKDAYDSKYVSKWFGVPEQCLEKIKGKFKDALKYMTHENAPNKYQYSENDVMSNFDWVVEKNSVSGDSRKEEILTKIASGEIREFNIHKLIDVLEYDKYKRSIENAFSYRQKMLLERKDRSMDCMFITGKSGSGKTSYAKMMCDRKGYSYFVSGSSNDPFDGYQGQDCIILDDLRGSSFSFADLLKITDNHTSSMVKSRYKNKILECKLLIITSVLEIEDFYKNVFESSNEPLVQFERRMKIYAKMDYDYINLYIYDNVLGYEHFQKFHNPITIQFENEGRNSHTVDTIRDLMGADFN